MQKQVEGGRSSCDGDTIHNITRHCAIKVILKLLNVTLSKMWKEREDGFMPLDSNRAKGVPLSLPLRRVFATENLRFSSVFTLQCICGIEMSKKSSCLLEQLRDTSIFPVIRPSGCEKVNVVSHSLVETRVCLLVYSFKIFLCMYYSTEKDNIPSVQTDDV